MTQKGLPGVGKRKDGRDRVKLTLLVTPESILGAREVSPSVSAAFEAVFEPEKDDLGVPGAEPPVASSAISPRGSRPSEDAAPTANANTTTQ
jgi:hypothetical protein